MMSCKTKVSKKEEESQIMMSSLHPKLPDFSLGNNSQLSEIKLSSYYSRERLGLFSVRVFFHQFQHLLCLKRLFSASHVESQ